MFRKIYVPVDNSDPSNASMTLAVRIAKTYGAEVHGSHVFAARMHDRRFRQMEFTLPEEYRQEEELERQRDVHDDLIGSGLRLVSDSYLDAFEAACVAAGVPFTRHVSEGRAWQRVVEEVGSGGYDLVAMGAVGNGAAPTSEIGSVCQRVSRRVRTDVLVVRDVRPWEAQSGGILVCVDGGPHGFGGLHAALDLGRCLSRPVEAVAVYDPYLHYAVFRRMAGVLSKDAALKLRLEEQEALHERLIDDGLARIYRAHLDVAQSIAKDEGIDLKTTLLDGKAFDRVLEYAASRRPWMLVAGRIGYHSDSDMDIGSNAETLLRRAPCNVFLSSRTFVPPIEAHAEATVTWSPEALDRLSRAPDAVRGIARTATLRYAIEAGHTVVTSGVVDEAMARFMPRPGLAVDAPTWEPAALELLDRVESGPVRDRARARVEKTCRVEGVPIVTKGVASRLLANDVAPVRGDDLDWTPEALARIERVPAGFMREAARQRALDHACARGVRGVTLDVCEAGIDEARKRMRESMGPA